MLAESAPRYVPEPISALWRRQRLLPFPGIELRTPLVPDGISKGEVRPARKANNFSAIYEATVYAIWDPQHLTILYTYTACNWIVFKTQWLSIRKGGRSWLAKLMPTFAGRWGVVWSALLNPHSR
jgi:hypothetical protein